MDQKTGIRSLYAEFFRGYGAETGCLPRFPPNSTYKQAYALGLLKSAARMVAWVFDMVRFLPIAPAHPAHRRWFLVE